MQLQHSGGNAFNEVGSNNIGHVNSHGDSLVNPKGSPPQSTAVDPAVEAVNRNRLRTEPEHFSLRSWIRNAPWSQYFKDGCRLIVKSPLNFFIFFCCLSVVVWGAFLVLLMGNMVKLTDSATQKLWIEIASQVLNGFFTIANVPVHPKRFLGLFRGILIWREDKTLRQLFLDRYLHIIGTDQSAGHDQNRKQELLRMFDFYRCFPDFGRDRVKATMHTAVNHEHSTDNDSIDRSKSANKDVAKVVVSRSRSRSRSRSKPRSSSVEMPAASVSWEIGSLDKHCNTTNPANTFHPAVVVDTKPPTDPQDISTTYSDTQPSLASPSEARIRVDISEDDLNGLLSEETHRVVQSIVLPFLPFPLDMPTFSEDTSNVVDMDAAHDQQVPLQSDESMHRIEQGFGTISVNAAASSTPQKAVQHGSSFAALPRMTSKRASPRTRARTMTMSMARDPDVGSDRRLARRSTFVVHDYSPVPSDRAQSQGHKLDIGGQTSTVAFNDLSHNISSSMPEEASLLIPMPKALTKDQMDWIDEKQTHLLKRQYRLQKAWPWYNYTIPTGIEPVDFFASPGNLSVPLRNAQQDHAGLSPTMSDRATTDGIMLSSLPSDLVMTPQRFCLIVGSFNINSMIQEVLCGFMWGMNYHIRPGWVVGTGMAFGCLAAIVPSVLIMLHEHAMSKIRVVATAEEAIQDALEEKAHLKSS
ncbi:hypothetical protein BGX28_007071 [Mortierella sp. GBA30]|nr:hypothetical protein BGX28_007071 [Mortierella sp. GBA30]